MSVSSGTGDRQLVEQGTCITNTFWVPRNVNTHVQSDLMDYRSPSDEAILSRSLEFCSNIVH